MHPAADRIGDPFAHCRQQEAPVEAEAIPSMLTTGVLVNVEGVECGAIHRASGLSPGQPHIALGAVEPLEFRQGKTCLKRDHPAGHDLPGVSVSLCGPGLLGAERAWS